MVSQLNNKTTARDAGYEMAQYIAGRLTADGTGNALQIKMGTIPAGALITGIQTRVITAFAGGTPTVTIGTLGSASNLVLAINEQTAGITENLVPTTQLTLPFTVDTDIYMAMASAATAGDMQMTIGFIKPVA